MRSAPALLVLVTTLAATSAAQAGTTARIVSPVGFVVSESSIAAGGRGQGRTGVLMTGYEKQGSKIRHRVIAKVGSIRTLGKTQQLSTHLGEQPRLAIGADGTVAAAWLEGARGLRLAIALPGKPFSPVQKIRALTPGSDLDRVFVGGVAVTPSGRAVATWRDGMSVAVSIAEPGQRFAAPVSVGHTTMFTPSITTGSGRSAVLAWIDSPDGSVPSPSASAQVLATALTASKHAFAAPTTLSTMSFWGRSSVAVGTGPGGAAVAWTQDSELRVSRLASTGFTVPVGTPVERSSDRGFGVATDPDGAVPTLWATATTGDDDETLTSGVVHASSLLPGGVFSAPQDVSSQGWTSTAPSVAALADRTVSVWGSTKGKHGAVVVKERAFRGDWKSLGSVDADGLVGSVQVAASQQHAVVAWIRTASPSGRQSPLYLWTYDVRAAS